MYPNALIEAQIAHIHASSRIVIIKPPAKIPITV